MFPTSSNYKINVCIADQFDENGEPDVFTELKIGADVDLWSFDATSEPFTGLAWSALEGASNDEKLDDRYANWENKGGSFVVIDASRFYNLNMGKELEDIAEAMDKLGIKISFAKLIDEKFNFEDNPDSDGLYVPDVKSGVATKVKYKDMEKILYFVIYSQGAYTEMGDKPIFRIPRVLENEEIFVDVVLESLKIGQGPSKDPSGSDEEDDRKAYADWYNSLSRREKEEMADEGEYPPPSMYGRERYGRGL
jgi:hypothetical protein